MLLTDWVEYITTGYRSGLQLRRKWQCYFINNIAAGKTTYYIYDKNDSIIRMSEGANKVIHV